MSRLEGEIVGKKEKKKNKNKVPQKYLDQTSYYALHYDPQTMSFVDISEKSYGTSHHKMMEETVTTLDSQDPFEKAILDIVKMNRKKRADYALDGNPFSNFEFTSSVMGMGGAEESAIFNVAQKLARLSSLRGNRRLPQNEAVEDTYLDLAVYGVIAYAIYLARRSADSDGNVATD